MEQEPNREVSTFQRVEPGSGTRHRRLPNTFCPACPDAVNDGFVGSHENAAKARPLCAGHL